LSFTEKRTNWTTSLLRKAGIVAVAAGLTFSTASAAEHLREVPTAILSQADGSIKVIMHEELADGSALHVENCYRSGAGWDLKKLRRIQKAYYDAAKLCQSANSTNGVPNQILDMLPVITKVARRYGLDYRLIVSIIYTETLGYRYAVGPVGELGLMQINVNDPSVRPTRRQHEGIFDPEVNISLGASILKKDLGEFGGNTVKAIEAYNAGPECVILGRVPKVTRNRYVAKVNECMRDMRELTGRETR
jgi:hypothetical protein